MQTDEQADLIVKIRPSERGNPTGKLADVELHFAGRSMLAGLKLIGFSIWEGRVGRGRKARPEPSCIPPDSTRRLGFFFGLTARLEAALTPSGGRATIASEIAGPSPTMGWNRTESPPKRPP